MNISRFLFYILFIHTTCAIRLYSFLPSPMLHELYTRHLTKPPELSLYSPRNDTFVPGFGCCRSFNMKAPLSDWINTLDLYTNASQSGGFGDQGLANIVWPGAGSALTSNWPDLAQLFESRHLPATDLGGFVPGGLQMYDANAALNFTLGETILGSRFLGFDMGEQDVRYLWGYSSHSNLLTGPMSRFEHLVAFRDFSDAIEQRLALKLAALASSTYGVHHWLKTGLYTLAGAETSQSNGNAQVLYAFVRGAAKSYGTLYYGQVSIFNWFGYKIPGDPSPSTDCVDQSSHSDTCGTSFSLMKRLMYTQLAYNSAYFAYEGELTYSTNSSLITPIGTLQLSARSFYAAAATSSSSSSSSKTLSLGVHVPSIAIMLDFVGGYVRPCDSRPKTYTAGSWGAIPWDSADQFTDAILDTLYPGYRSGALMHDESGYISPTPFGDSVDVLLSDALLSVLQLYDTIVFAHRAETDIVDVSFRLNTFISNGGNVIVTASTLSDLGGLAGITVTTCTSMPAGTKITMTDGSADIVETRPLVLCSALQSGENSWTVLATAPNGSPVVVRVPFASGFLVAILAGNYGMSTARDTNAPPLYSCSVDEKDTRAAQPLQMAEFVRHFIEQSLKNTSLFDLGSSLAWVPSKETTSSYILTITNPTLAQESLHISSKIGTIDYIEVLPLDESEKTAIGYLPHGFANASIGTTTNTTLAGGDTLIVRVVLQTDKTSDIPIMSPPIRKINLASRRLLRLNPSIGDLRRAILLRPQFEEVFGGFLIDYSYIASRTNASLTKESIWLRSRGISLAIDFSRSTTLFPGLRLSDDMDGSYQESLSVFLDVLSKMSLIGATDAFVTIHNGAEIAPSNFSTSADYTASITTTLQTLSQIASKVGIRIHLRRSFRNDNFAGASLTSQANFAATAKISFSPSLAYQDPQMGSDNAIDAANLFVSGASHALMISAAWLGASRSLEGAPVSPILTPESREFQWLKHVLPAAEAAGAWVVIDGAFDESKEGLAGSLADARAIELIALG
jgi:hypothetical protein